MFLLVNPQMKVKDLFVLHIRCKERKNGTIDRIAKLINVDPLPISTCKALLEAEVKGEQFVMPEAEPQKELVVDESLIRHLLQKKAEVEEQLSNIKAKLLSDMEALGETTYITPTGIRIVRKLESVRRAFDMKAFTSSNPTFDLTPYMKESRVASSLSIAA